MPHFLFELKLVGRGRSREADWQIQWGSQSNVLQRCVIVVHLFRWRKSLTEVKLQDLIASHWQKVGQNWGLLALSLLLRPLYMLSPKKLLNYYDLCQLCSFFLYTFLSILTTVRVFQNRHYLICIRCTWHNAVLALVETLDNTDTYCTFWSEVFMNLLQEDP